jgi:hypothetical protein
MIDFDPAKEAINLLKHRMSLARWIDLEVRAIVEMIVSITANLDSAHTDISKASRIAWFLPFATNDIARSVFGAFMQRK